MSASLWQAVEGLSDCWSASRFIQNHAAVLQSRGMGVGGLVNEMAVELGGIPHAQPLLQSRLLQASPKSETLRARADGQRFLEDGNRIADAFLLTIGWLRSALPGYPMLGIPHLLPQGPWRMKGLNSQVPWLIAEIPGLQFQSEPPGVDQLLELPTKPLGEASRAVHSELRKSLPMEELRRVRNALTTEDRETLKALNQEATKRLKPQEIENRAGNLLITDIQYRESVIRDLGNTLDAEPANFFRAVEAAALLIDQVGALLSQIVVYGPPPRLGSVDRIERQSNYRWAKVRVLDDRAFWPFLNSVVLFDTSLLPDAMVIHGMSLHISDSQSGLGSAVLSGPLLPDSGSIGVS